MGNILGGDISHTERNRLGYASLPDNFARPLAENEVGGFAMTTDAPPEPEITTRRLVLRPLRDSDRLALCQLCETDASHLEPTGSAPLATETLDDPDAFSAWLDDLAFLRSIDQRYDFAMVADDELVGLIALHGVVRGHLQCAWDATWIGEAYEALGYAQEGQVALLQFAFERLGLHRVEAAVLVDNEPALVLARRIGFRDAGVAPRYLEVNGVWRDHRRFEITTEEWLELRTDLLAEWGRAADQG
jgi:[ribosomal protein S5]-alanine N-acetyltransferase